MGSKADHEYGRELLQATDSVLKFRFNEETMIEDTASSHDVIIQGRKGVYHFERLVVGARKGEADYLAAVFRWSKGAVQLLWTSYIPWKHFYWWPWLSLVLYVIPIMFCIAFLEMINVESIVEDGEGWVYYTVCHGFGVDMCTGNHGHLQLYNLVLNPVYIGYVIWMVLVVIGGFLNRRICAYMIMVENTVYPFTAICGALWVIFPVVMCITGDSPVSMDATTLVFGALWMQLNFYIILSKIKSWAPLDEGKKPPEISMLRAQQMYFLTPMLHLYAIVQGSISGFGIVFLNRDASFWSSFDNTTPLVIAKVWTICLFTLLVSSMITGIVRGSMCLAGLCGGTFQSYVLGTVLVALMLLMVTEPMMALFFLKSMVKQKLRGTQSLYERVSQAVCGQHMTITLNQIYLVLWFGFGIFIALSPTNGVFRDVLNSSDDESL